MVRLDKHPTSDVVKLSGSECEVMLFYCFWQSYIWPDWMNHSKLGDESDSATRQHKAVIENVNEGRELLLHNCGDQFHNAQQYAADRCRLLGVEVKTA